jgi:hypothetical protein
VAANLYVLAEDAAKQLQAAAVSASCCSITSGSSAITAPAMTADAAKLAAGDHMYCFLPDISYT